MCHFDLIPFHIFDFPFCSVPFRLAAHTSCCPCASFTAFPAVRKMFTEIAEIAAIMCEELKLQFVTIRWGFVSFHFIWISLTFSMPWKGGERATGWLARKLCAFPAISVDALHFIAFAAITMQIYWKKDRVSEREREREGNADSQKRRPSESYIDLLSVWQNHTIFNYISKCIVCLNGISSNHAHTYTYTCNTCCYRYILTVS